MTTTDPMTSAAPAVEEPELIGFVLSHSAFRAELPRLSAAFAAAMTPEIRDVAEDHLRRALAERAMPPRHALDVRGLERVALRGGSACNASVRSAGCRSPGPLG